MLKEITPNHESEYEDQVVKYIKRGYPNILKLDVDKYRRSLPKPVPLPEIYGRRFKICVLVDPRIPFSEQARLAGVDISLIEKQEVGDWKEDPEGFRVPPCPYITWVQYEISNVDAIRFRKKMAPDERGAGMMDAIALYIRKPNILEGLLSVDLPGTWLKYNRILSMGRRKGIPSFYPSVGGADRYISCATCTRQIVTLNSDVAPK